MYPETILFQVLITIAAIAFFALVMAVIVGAIIYLVGETLPTLKGLKKTINEIIREWKQ